MSACVGSGSYAPYTRPEDVMRIDRAMTPRFGVAQPLAATIVTGGCGAYASTGEIDWRMIVIRANNIKVPPRVESERRRWRGRESRSCSMRATTECLDPTALGAASGAR